MDVYKALRELHKEKERLDAVIASLEAKMKASVAAAKRRGRKTMGAEERRAVSQRMAAYWAARRAAHASTDSPEERKQASTSPAP